MARTCCDQLLFTQTDFLEEIKCAICLDMMINPVILTCTNKHSLCTCPLWFKQKYVKNNILANIIDKLERKCEHEKCKWIDKHEKYKKHIKNECLYTTIKCSYCKIEYTRNNQDDHFSTCQELNIKCEFCNIVVKRKMIDQHNSSCLEQIIDCTECKEKIKKKNQNNHILKDCQIAKSNCKYYKYGCEEKLNKKDMIEHLLHDAAKHLHMIEKYDAINITNPIYKISSFTCDFMRGKGSKLTFENNEIIIEWSDGGVYYFSKDIKYRAIGLSIESFKISLQTKPKTTVFTGQLNVVLENSKGWGWKPIDLLENTNYEIVMTNIIIQPIKKL
jgi:hypothetical protein